MSMPAGCTGAQDRINPPVNRIRERRRYSTDPKTFQALMTLAAEVNSTKIGFALTRGIAQRHAGRLVFPGHSYGRKKPLYCLWLRLDPRKRTWKVARYRNDAIPLLANAIQRGRPLRLPASSTSSDLKALGQMLNLSNPGNLLSVPINTRQGVPLGGILILSPYSNRLWSAEDQEYLTNVSPLYIPILDRGPACLALWKGSGIRPLSGRPELPGNRPSSRKTGKEDRLPRSWIRLHEKESPGTG